MASLLEFRVLYYLYSESTPQKNGTLPIQPRPRTVKSSIDVRTTSVTLIEHSNITHSSCKQRRTSLESLDRRTWSTGYGPRSPRIRYVRLYHDRYSFSSTRRGAMWPWNRQKMLSTAESNLAELIKYACTCIYTYSL